MRAQASVGAALAALGQRIDVLARERQSLVLRARALELAAAIRDVLRSKDEIVPLAESFHRLLLKDLAVPPDAQPEAPAGANGEDKPTKL